jgi:mercuric ion transport protein
MTTHAKKLSIGGAVLAALAASSCCIVPLLLAALGVGGAGAVATLGAYRPYLLAATGALLIAGFYFTYRKPRAAADACGCERPRTSSAGRIALWIATVAVLVVAAAPLLLARWAQVGDGGSDAMSDPTLSHATVHVDGIDCDACAAPMRKALAKVGGLRDLRLNVEKQEVVLAYENAPGRLQAYVAAINALGYEAELPASPEARR